MNAELPPLFTYYDIAHGMVEVAKVADVEARERILQARIAELGRLWQSAEARYAEADAAAMSHAKRIAELDAALSKVRHRLECTPTHMASDIEKIVDAAREAK